MGARSFTADKPWVAVASLTNPNFGRLTSSSDLLNEPRRMQFALKLYF